MAHDSHCTARALETILKHIRREWLPENISASHQRREKQKELESCDVFGDLIRCVKTQHVNERDEVPVYVAHPLGLLQRAVRKDAFFREFVTRTLGATGNRMQCMIFSDEVTPGQVLEGDQNRNTLCVYWSLVEFGYPALSHEAAWFTVAVVRSKTLAQIRGGANRIFQIVLGYFFGTETGANGTQFDLRKGVVFEWSPDIRPELVFGALDIMVQDALAHKDVAATKGHNRVKLCPLCKHTVYGMDQGCFLTTQAI